MSLIASDQFRVIIGVGQTGLSVARYLKAKGAAFAACDTREGGSAIEQFKQEFPEIVLTLGELDANFLARASELILSPGVAKDQPAIERACQSGSKLLGDIDLFAREIKAPVVAITGSNGKSTVTSLLGEMAKAAGRKVAVGGNIGVPALDLLQLGEVDLYVLELSSFQLETMNELKPTVATVLNMSADHLDRYSGMPAYHRAKHRIFRGCEVAIFNRQDPLSRPLVPNTVRTQGYGLNVPDLGQYGLLERSGETWFARGSEALMPASKMRIRGRHNMANALAALALGEAVGLEPDAMLQAIQKFGGLEHRCQWIRECKGVHWFNDSKGTNVGATLAALEGLGGTLKGDQKIVLIAGGQGKQQSFTALKKPVNQYVRSVVLIGEDAGVIDTELAFENTLRASSLQEAMERAATEACAGDLVLLSPACASLDMFKSYVARGDQFVEILRGMSC